jgi:hypothetical protein
MDAEAGARVTSLPYLSLVASCPSLQPEFFDGHPKPKAFKSLLFGLAFMHAFVQV